MRYGHQYWGNFWIRTITRTTTTIDIKGFHAGLLAKISGLFETRRWCVVNPAEIEVDINIASALSFLICSILSALGFPVLLLRLLRPSWWLGFCKHRSHSLWYYHVTNFVLLFMGRKRNPIPDRPEGNLSAVGTSAKMEEEEIRELWVATGCHLEFTWWMKPRLNLAFRWHLSFWQLLAMEVCEWLYCSSLGTAAPSPVLSSLTRTQEEPPAAADDGLRVPV